MSAKLKTSFEFVEIPSSNESISMKKEFQVGFFIGTSFRCKGRFDSIRDAVSFASRLVTYVKKPIKIYSLTLTIYEL